MATNKNQHFVPRCYLRAFTLDTGNAAINVFNIDRKRLIRNAPVKNQCSKDYFYGQDQQLEDAIQLIESGYANALRAVIADQRSLTECSKTIFRTFWLFQHIRTEAAAMRAVQMADSTRDLVDLSPEEFTLGIKEAVQMGCRNFAGAMHELDDLKFCIIKNKTKIPFITSDNPAVFTNRWQIDSRRTRGLSFGIGSAGMLVLLPLTPKLMFIGYDGDVYGVTHVNGIAEINSDRDVIAFNRHQFLQCVANIYVHDASYEELICKHLTDIESARPKIRHRIHYAQLDCSVGGHSRYVVVPAENRDETKEAIMHSQVIHPNPIIWPSQIQNRRNGSVYTNGTGMGYVRHSRTMTSTIAPFWKERA
ncbi:DUF4238 domain-containing protein [Undibacterium sp.]|uniref:DUF4238 domain-containing protein n=1 Tax=Undibacterium sp. TaxID=1914977 RepID=UPI0025FCE59E|nr:DUF4238 domain-containing protein [Undibacterium sp.]